jgi:hypothetical protein
MGKCSEQGIPIQLSGFAGTYVSNWWDLFLNPSSPSRAHSVAHDTWAPTRCNNAQQSRYGVRILRLSVSHRQQSGFTRLHDGLQHVQQHQSRFCPSDVNPSAAHLNCDNSECDPGPLSSRKGSHGLTGDQARKSPGFRALGTKLPRPTVLLPSPWSSLHVLSHTHSIVLIGYSIVRMKVLVLGLPRSGTQCAWRSISVSLPSLTAASPCRWVRHIKGLGSRSTNDGFKAGSVGDDAHLPHAGSRQEQAPGSLD